MDDQGTFIAWLPDVPALTLRVSVISFKAKDGSPERHLGAEYCREEALGKGLSVEELGDRVCVHEQKLTEEDRTPLRIDTWMIGGDLSIAILSLTTELARHYGVAPHRDLTPTQLDRLFARWLSDAADRASGERVAHAVGAAFGEHLVRSAGMRWVVVTDEYGRSRGVRHPRGNTIAFPVESVQKRIATGETDFLDNLAVVVAHQIAKGEPPA